MRFSPLLIGDRFEASRPAMAGGMVSAAVSVPSSSGIGLKLEQFPNVIGTSTRFSPLLIGDRFEARQPRPRSVRTGLPAVSVPSSSGIGLKQRRRSSARLRAYRVSVPSSSGIGLKPVETTITQTSKATGGFSPLLIGDRFEADGIIIPVERDEEFVSVPSSSGIGLKRCNRPIA